MRAVHPHSRGEHSTSASASAEMIGSSPLAWGTRDSRAAPRDQTRFIPTRVGNTTSLPLDEPADLVHPHSRGEHASPTPVIACSIGSSPLAWGTRTFERVRETMPRFIPTRVGNTEPLAFPSHSVAVHPHSRGEHSEPLLAASQAAGSSPLAWGTQQTVTARGGGQRFIPTRVGNTLRKEKDGLDRFGSSPLAWGTLTGSYVALAWGRFIPTRVGNTNTGPRNRRPRPVHPHSRGEHTV